MSCHNCIGVDIAGLRDEVKRLNAMNQCVCGSARGNDNRCPAHGPERLRAELVITRERLDEQLRENDRLLAVIGELTRGRRHEDAERAVGAHLRVDETPGAVPEKEQEE